MSKTIFALAAAAIVGTASFASAESTNSAGNYFGGVETIKANSVFEVALLTSAQPGTLTIYNYNAGTQGAALGEVAVNAGANADVRINLGVPPRNDVIAVLTIDGQVAATQVYDVTAR